MDRTDDGFKGRALECVKVLLDKGAEVNIQEDKVSGVIIHCVHAMQHVPRVPSSECRHVNRKPLLRADMCMPCCLITESSTCTSLDKATCKESMHYVMVTSITNNTWKDKCKYPSSWLKSPVLFIPFKWTNISFVMLVYWNVI